MLHVLQYFTGTSIAAMSEVAGLIITQSLVGGPIVMGSSAGSGGGIGCKFRGRIPGLTSDAWMKEDMQMKAR